ncbi:MAG: hypothetical protein CMI90_01455 [Pelagibacteraceae bacterium]|nr:hypothetical protein [Pelagibacteraceae bacterium]|tara:strand:- start:114 stop:488 length:375 start_codon:yes stop_codon:yes gene_type:complete
MSSKLSKYLLMKKNLKLILNTMIPGDNYMPCFTKAVKVEKIIKRLNNDKFLDNLKKREINLSKKKNWDNCVKILGSDIIEIYFTSNSAIKSLKLKKRDDLKNVKKENMIKLLKEVKYKKKIFRN